LHFEIILYIYFYIKNPCFKPSETGID